MEKSKAFLIGIIFLLVIIGFAYLAHISKNTVSKELYESEKLAMQDSIDASRQREIELRQKDSLQIMQLDSLEKKQAEYAKETEAAKDQIDQILARDSTQALRENRKALALLGINISSGPFLSNYEMGWNAKFLQENYGLKLQIKVCDETKDSLKSNIKTQKQIISEKEKQYESADSLRSIADNNAEYWNDKYDATQGFWNDRLIFYGGIGINYNRSIDFGIQAGIGFRITTIKFGGGE